MTLDQIQKRLIELEQGLTQLSEQKNNIEIQLRRQEGAILVLRELLQVAAPSTGTGCEGDAETPPDAG